MITAQHPIYPEATYGLFCAREKRGYGDDDNFARENAVSGSSIAARRQNSAISRLSVIV